MIIKQTRIPPDDAHKFANYLASEGENAKILFEKGEPGDVIVFEVPAVLHGKSYSIRHLMISPEQPITKDQLKICIFEFFKEFKLTPEMLEQCVIVVHKKTRASGKPSDLHYHIAFPEVDMKSGEVMSSSFLNQRNEYLARKLELMLGHKITLGAHNKSVYKRLVEEGVQAEPYRKALLEEALNSGMSDAEAQETYLDLRKRAGFDHAKHRALKAVGINASELTRALRQIPKESPRILRTPKLYAEAIRRTVRSFGGKLYYDEFSGILGIKIKEKVIPGLKKMLGLPEATFRNCQIYIKEIALDDRKTNDEENPEIKFDRRRLQNSADTGRSIDDFDGSTGSWSIWRQWRKSISDAYGTVGAFNRQHRYATQRDDEGDQDEFELDSSVAGDTGKTAAQVFSDTQNLKLPSEFNFSDFYLKQVKWLSYVASAKLKQKSRDVPPEFKKPLIETTSKLVAEDFEPETANR